MKTYSIRFPTHIRWQKLLQSLSGQQLLVGREQFHVSYYMCWYERKIASGPTWHAPLTVKHIISSDINVFFFSPLSLSRIWLASCFNPNHFSGLLFCHETRAVNEIHTLTGYTAEHRGNCRLWCHQLILTIWIKKKKSVNVTASKFNMTCAVPSDRALGGGETACEYERGNFGANL